MEAESSNPGGNRDNVNETGRIEEAEGVEKEEKVGNTSYEIYAAEDLPEILNKRIQQQAETLGIKPSANIVGLGAHPDSLNEVLAVMNEAAIKDPNLKTYLVSLTPGGKSKIYKGIMAAKCVFSGQFGKLRDLENLAVAPRRAKELYRTAEKMGFEAPIILNLPDQGLKEKSDEVEKIVQRTIKGLGPDNINGIFTTDPSYTVGLVATSEPHSDHQVVGSITTEVCDELRLGNKLFYCLFDPDKAPKDEQIEIRLSKGSLKKAKEALRGRIDLIISARPAYKKTIGRLRSRTLEEAKREQGLKDQDKIKELREKMQGMWENDQ